MTLAVKSARSINDRRVDAQSSIRANCSTSRSRQATTALPSASFTIIASAFMASDAELPDKASEKKSGFSSDDVMRERVTFRPVQPMPANLIWYLSCTRRETVPSTRTQSVKCTQFTKMDGWRPVECRREGLQARKQLAGEGKIHG